MAWFLQARGFDLSCRHPSAAGAEVLKLPVPGRTTTSRWSLPPPCPAPAVPAGTGPLHSPSCLSPSAMLPDDPAPRAAASRAARARNAQRPVLHHLSCLGMSDLASHLANRVHGGQIFSIRGWTCVTGDVSPPGKRSKRASRHRRPGTSVHHSHQGQATGAPGSAARLEESCQGSPATMFGLSESYEWALPLSWGLQHENPLSPVGRENEEPSR